MGVRRVAGGAFSTWVHGQLKAGDTLQVLQPQGRFGQAAADLAGSDRAARAVTPPP